MKYKVYNHNDTFLGEFDTRKEADDEAVKYTNATGNAAYVSSDYVTKAELFLQQAPSFNFELDADQLLAKALELGYVTKVEGEDDLFKINQEY